MGADFLTDLESCVPSLRRYARALLRHPDDADDLVQDCLERAIARRHLWYGGPSLRPWLFRIMRNLHANGIRACRARLAPEPLDAIERVPGRTRRRAPGSPSARWRRPSRGWAASNGKWC